MAACDGLFRRPPGRINTPPISRGTLRPRIHVSSGKGSPMRTGLHYVLPMVDPSNTDRLTDVVQHALRSVVAFERGADPATAQPWADDNRTLLVALHAGERAGDSEAGAILNQFVLVAGELGRSHGVTTAGTSMESLQAALQYAGPFAEFHALTQMPEAEWAPPVVAAATAGLSRFPRLAALHSEESQPKDARDAPVPADRAIAAAARRYAEQAPRATSAATAPKPAAARTAVAAQPAVPRP